MSSRKIGINVLIFLLTLASGGVLQAEVNAAAPTASTKSAQSLHERLNALYLDLSPQCAGGRAAYHCSGVLLRRTIHDPTREFWIHKSQAATLGSITLSYLRDDVVTSGNDIHSGFLLMDDATAQANDKTVQPVRCIYPFMAATQGNNRAENGCGLLNSSQASSAHQQSLHDQSSCPSVLPNVAPDSWIKYFKNAGMAPNAQCSLSSQDGAGFLMSLGIRNAPELRDVSARHSNEVLIATWDESNPHLLPIAAFFYNPAKADLSPPDPNKPDAFESALALRDDYYAKTALLLPIVMLDLDAKDGIFKPLPPDKLGKATARGLNLRYNRIDDTCGQKAAPYCNGVILRVITHSSDTLAWNPNVKSQERKGVSFSFIRKDLGTKKLAWAHIGYLPGLIFKQLDSLSSPDMYPLSPACFFVSDGDTFNRAPPSSCGTNRKSNSTPSPCNPEHTVSLAEFKKNYEIPDGRKDRNTHQCALNMNPDTFAIGIRYRREEMRADEKELLNELVITTWPQDIPQQLPLEAALYQAQDTAGGSRLKAQAIQKDLIAGYQISIPIIRVDLAAPDDKVFTFLPDDQTW